MIRIKDFFIILFAIALISVGIAVYLLVKPEDNKQDSAAEVAASTTELPNSSQNSNNQTQPTLQSQSGNPSLQVNGGQSSNQPQQNRVVLPTPDQFGQYNQYAAEGQLLYIDEVVGQGQEAKAGSSVAMLYRGWLTNGQLFDQTTANESGQIQPFVFQLGARQVIPGWDQGIMGMKVGGKRRLVIPSEYGYGPNGQGPIPPNAMLIFDVELVAVQ